ncbi:MAG TPA: hypothetical protein VFA05_11760 [Gaiellaceae bacterium]|nr:hypothetical protein [Gaiellaceae bacterium]
MGVATSLLFALLLLVLGVVAAVFLPGAGFVILVVFVVLAIGIVARAVSAGRRAAAPPPS